MAVIVRGKSRCRLCGRILEEDDEIVGFPAFLPPGHELSIFSEAAFHVRCFTADPRSPAVRSLFARYESIWASRPENLTSLDEIESWGREAFKDFP